MPSNDASAFDYNFFLTIRCDIYILVFWVIFLSFVKAYIYFFYLSVDYDNYNGETEVSAIWWNCFMLYQETWVMIEPQQQQIHEKCKKWRNNPYLLCFILFNRRKENYYLNFFFILWLQLSDVTMLEHHHISDNFKMKLLQYKNGCLLLRWGRSLCVSVCVRRKWTK